MRHSTTFRGKKTIIWLELNVFFKDNCFTKLTTQKKRLNAKCCSPTCIQHGSQLIEVDVTLAAAAQLFDQGQPEKVGGQRDAGQQGNQGVGVHHWRTAVPGQQQKMIIPTTFCFRHLENFQEC
jgi:hypothetical protein